MNKIFYYSVLIMLWGCGKTAPVLPPKEYPVESNGLFVTINIKDYDSEHDTLPVELHLKNTSDKVIRVWESWNSWGAYNRYFELQNNRGEIIRFFNPQRVWYANFPSYKEIEPGKTRIENFKLIMRLEHEDVDWPFYVYAFDKQTRGELEETWLGAQRELGGNFLEVETVYDLNFNGGEIPVKLKNGSLKVPGYFDKNGDPVEKIPDGNYKIRSIFGNTIAIFESELKKDILNMTLEEDQEEGASAKMREIPKEVWVGAIASKWHEVEIDR